jgi:hypothetical protein
LDAEASPAAILAAVCGDKGEMIMTRDQLAGEVVDAGEKPETPEAWDAARDRVLAAAIEFVEEEERP